MERDIMIALLNNATLLLFLSVIYEVTYIVPSRFRRIQPIFSGIFIALICSAVMRMPLTLQSGIVFDTRSILISVAALIFGAIPAFITVAVAAIVRLSMGGVGLLPGIAVIITSALIGLAWRRWLYPKSTKWRCLIVFAMSIVVHAVMLACMLLLPYPDNQNVIRAITMPVMLIYPVASVLLSLLLMHQQELRRMQKQLKQSEERFKLLFDKAPLGYQSLDLDGCFIDVNQQWCDLLGYSRDEVIGKWFGDFLSPENKEIFLKRFPVFKEQGYVHSEFEVLHKRGNPLFLSFEGKIGYGFDGAFKQTHCILQDITQQKAAEAALIESETKYRNIAENMSDVVWQADLNLNTTYVSPSVKKLLGDSPEEHLKRKLEDKFSEQTIQKIQTILREELEKENSPQVDQGRSRTVEVEHLRADGTVIWVEMNVSILHDPHGNPVGFLGVTRDIMQRKLAELALRESERSKSVFLSNLPGLAYRCNYDREWTMQYVSAGCFELTGYHPDRLLNKSFADLITYEYRERLWKAWEGTLAKRTQFRYEYEIITAHGVRKWVMELGQGVYNDQGEVEALEGIILDISDRKEMENRLIYFNEHDRWTGLYNRAYLESLLEQDAKLQINTKRALISINLSTVQLLTANYGFHYAQNLVKKAAEALSQYCTEKRILFSTYDNNFVFYFVDYKDKNELMEFIQTITDVLESLFRTEKVGGGIGVLEIDQDHQLTVDLLLRRLLAASEKATNTLEKDFGVYFYDEALDALINREWEISRELSRIAADDDSDELFLLYQPILDLKSDSVCGFEALARFRTEKLGLVSPVEFIPIAEKTKLILPLGKRILCQALRFLNKLNDFGYKTINVSINVSAVELLRPDFPSNLIDMISEMKANPENIGIEITETIFTADYDYMNNVIKRLRDAGLHIAIDDFGTGYSSLAREKGLNVDCLKIDRYFIDKLLEIDPDKAISGDIISMAHRLGHCVIAEGVEREDQKHYLQTHGCDKIQGYLVGKPLDEKAAFSLLAKQAMSDR